MHDLLSYPPREMIAWLCVIFCVGAGAALLIIATLPAPEPPKPWRWGEASRRGHADDGVGGAAAGIVLFLVIVSLGVALSRSLA